MFGLLSKGYKIGSSQSLLRYQKEVTYLLVGSLLSSSSANFSAVPKTPLSRLAMRLIEFELLVVRRGMVLVVVRAVLESRATSAGSMLTFGSESSESELRGGRVNSTDFTEGGVIFTAVLGASRRACISVTAY